METDLKVSKETRSFIECLDTFALGFNNMAEAMSLMYRDEDTIDELLDAKFTPAYNKAVEVIVEFMMISIEGNMNFDAGRTEI